MNHTSEHQKLVNDILLELSKIPGVRAWPRRVGLAIPIHREEPVYFGVKGETDIGGFVSVKKWDFIEPPGEGWKPCRFAQALAIEVKTGSGRRTTEQIAYAEMCLVHGAAYFLARDVESCLQFVKNLTR